jgi:hypothetical protein
MYGNFGKEGREFRRQSCEVSVSEKKTQSLSTKMQFQQKMCTNGKTCAPTNIHPNIHVVFI